MLIKQQLRVLIIEDNPSDIRLIKEVFKDAKKIYPDACDYSLITAGTMNEGINICQNKNIDLTLLDLSLPDSAGISSVEVFLSKTESPVVVLTGTDDFDTALEAIKHGAQDYLVKGDFDEKLLFRVISYAIERNRLRNKLEKTVAELNEAMANVKTLQGMIPICAACKNIRDDKGFWSQVEDYIRRHSDVQFTHGICPECQQELYGDILNKNQ